MVLAIGSRVETQPGVPVRRRIAGPGEWLGGSASTRQGYVGDDNQQGPARREQRAGHGRRADRSAELPDAACDHRRRRGASGCLVGFSTQCSIDPVRFIVCLSDKNHTTRVALSRRPGRSFPARRGGGPGRALRGETGDEVDKFSRCQWHTGPLGLPIIDRVPPLVRRRDPRAGSSAITSPSSEPATPATTKGPTP